MAMEHIILPLRGVQALFAVVILGLTAYVASSNFDYGFGYSIHLSINQVNFMIFNSVFTLLGLAYIVLCPRFAPSLAHKFALLAVDALLCLFWFAGFIALAVIIWIFSGSSAYGAGAAACAFGAFEWLLFVATTVLSALTVFGHGGHKTHGVNDPVV